jgi:hypothetical protein
LFTLSPEIEDVMVVCASKVAFQRGIECLGCGLLVFVGIASCLLAVVRVAALSSHAATNMNACRCKTLADLPVKLRLTRLALQSDYSERFHPFFVWLFDMGKNIAAMNSGACVSVVRSVPLLVRCYLLHFHPMLLSVKIQSVRDRYPPIPATCVTRSDCSSWKLCWDRGRYSPSSKISVSSSSCSLSARTCGRRSVDSWRWYASRRAHPIDCWYLRLCVLLSLNSGPHFRLLHQTTSGQIHKDLGNYDDDLTGGGSAWPCMIDDFVEYVQNSQ